MDFIMVPLIMGIITLGIYKLFELFACRRERMAIIEKLGDKISAADLKGKFSLPIYNHYSFSTVWRDTVKKVTVKLNLFIGMIPVSGKDIKGMGPVLILLKRSW